jgi:hypothetical protein
MPTPCPTFSPIILAGVNRAAFRGVGRPRGRNTLMGCLNFSWYDAKRKRARYKQAGRGGIGTVFADKGIKALVARWDTCNPRQQPGR